MLELSAWIRVVIDQTRITHSRYQVTLDTETTAGERTFRAALGELPSGGEALERAFSSVQVLVQQAELYVRTWTSYQSLWDLQADQIYNRLGEDLQVWMNVLDEVKGLRKHFDVAETQKDFGPLVIVFGKVQSKVSLKYDNWHKDILSRFGNNLAGNMNEFFGQVSKARSELEQQSIDAGSTGDAVNFITYTQQLKRKMKGWEKQVEVRLLLLMVYSMIPQQRMASVFDLYDLMPLLKIAQSSSLYEIKKRFLTTFNVRE